MAHIRNPDGTPAVFAIGDGRGNEAHGHFESAYVPSFAPGTRIGDLSFVIDRVVAKGAPEQVNPGLDLEAIHGPVA